MECLVCKSSNSKLKQCSRCHAAKYCSTDCQKADWCNHKALCTQIITSCTDVDSETYRLTESNQSSLASYCQESVTDSKKHLITYYGTQGRSLSDNIPSEVLSNPSNIEVFLKFGNRKTRLEVNNSWPGDYIIKLISNNTAISTDDMKIIIRGKIQTSGNIACSLANKVVVMVLGTPLESAEGLDERDIQRLMKQMRVNRNKAINALRKSGSLLDAMILLGNDYPTNI